MADLAKQMVNLTAPDRSKGGNSRAASGNFWYNLKARKKASVKRCFGAAEDEGAMLSNHPTKRSSAVSAVSRAVLGFVLVVVAATSSLEALADDILASIVRGGRLYDNWHMETKALVPQAPHPAYPADKRYANEPGVNWRCKECHGWDYLGRDGVYFEGAHFTGIKGIRALAGADPEQIIAILKDDTHAYDGLMSERDFRDLANFVSKGQVDMGAYIDRASRQAKGDKRAHEAYYATICANCHGRDGLKIRTMPPLGTLAKENPWEALHKILNGHPAESMPALRALGMPVLVDVLAYVQTLPAHEVLSSIVRGGRLYDNWLKEAEGSTRILSRSVQVVKKRHPAYPADKAYAANPELNWRCKECHGWDYLGRDGAYARGKHFTGIKGIRAMAEADPERIIAVLKDETHAYGGLMDDRDFRDLTNFVAKGQVDMDLYIDRIFKMAKGDRSRHKGYYTTICAACHGLDGFKVITMPSLGKVARSNPWEALHKILNGHPAENMPALRALDMSVLVDILSYVQTLPAEK
jgi:mono/diheme cytochrome c family protein